jgi:hypothetical protein
LLRQHPQGLKLILFIQINTALNDSLDSQLKRLGFHEQSHCETKAQVKEQLKKEQEFIISSCATQIFLLLQKLIKDNKFGSQEATDYLSTSLPRMSEYKERRLKELDQKIKMLEEKPVEQMKIYVKETPDPLNDQHKIFIVICKNNKVLNILTSVYEDNNEKFEGEITDVDFKNNIFGLQDKEGKKRIVQFEERDNSHEDYLAIWIKSVN